MKGLSRVLIVGVGGGGCNVVARMADAWDESSAPQCVAINTDERALQLCPLESRIQIGGDITRGMGTGGDAKVGEKAAESDAEILRPIFSGAPLVFLVATLGGGTGTGAAPVVARLARNEGALVIALVTRPFDFEGPRRKALASEGIAQLRAACDAVVLFPNTHVRKLSDEDSSLEQAFGAMDTLLGIGVYSLDRLLQHTGLIHLDFADLSSLVEQGHGVCYFGYGAGRGPDKVNAALQQLSSGPLLDEGRLLRRSSFMIVNVIGGPDLRMSDYETVMGYIRSFAMVDATLVPGALIDKEWTDRVGITVWAVSPWMEESAGRTTEGSRNMPLADAPVVTEPGVVEGVEPPDPVGVGGEAVAAGKKGRPRRDPKATLDLLSGTRNRFENSQPTVYAGEDLDVPTFVRRGIKITAVPAR